MNTNKLTDEQLALIEDAINELVDKLCEIIDQFPDDNCNFNSDFCFELEKRILEKLNGKQTNH